jgi:hypothetical protein
MDASDRTTRRKSRTLFADKIVQQTIFDKGGRVWIAREGGVNAGVGAMTYNPNFYDEQEGAIQTTPAELDALVDSVPNKFPNSPSSVSAALVSGQVVVSFSPPAPPVTSYTVISNPGGIRVTGSSSPITVTGLTLGSTYTFTVIATNSGGSSAPSAASNSVTTAAAPDAPTNLCLIPTVGGATVYFTAPANGGSPITNYQYSTNDGSTWTSAGVTVSPVTVAGLATGSVYPVKLRAVNAVNPGAASVAVSAAGLTTFSPADISGMNVWLDGQDVSGVIIPSGENVTAWNDKSLAANNFDLSGTGIITYDFPSDINNRPALNFTTSPGTFLTKRVNLAPTNQLTVFLVVRQTDTSGGNSELFFTINDYRYLDIFSQTNPGGSGLLSLNRGSATTTSSGVDIITVPPTNALISVVTDTTSFMYFNGGATDISGVARGGLSLNASLDWALSAAAFRGNYGELICYSAPLSEGDRQSVEGYLAWKWGLQDSLPGGHPYRNSQPVRPPSGNLYTAPSNMGDVAVVSTPPGIFAGNSYSFNGTSDYLSVVSDDSWDLGTGDFTIEWFQYKTDSHQYTRIFALGATSFGAPPGNFVSMQCSIESETIYAWFSSGVAFIESGAPSYRNSWQHFAIVRRSGTLRVYRNGAQIGEDESNTTDISNNTPLYFGAEIRLDGSSYQPPSTFFGGYLTNIRIVKGLAVYTGNFTRPTSALTETPGANPYGGSNTVAIPAGFTKLLFVP